MAASNDSSRPAPQKIAMIFSSSVPTFAWAAHENALAKLASISLLRKTGEDTVAGWVLAPCELGLTCCAI
ncbi:bsl8016 [Bradyrhizobium diazoefficiens USDA 110]|uniref:Bsl8016 protein n=1 Tax=Bradyrhizobium diazoefficiens (strain JCM 10833 / BCRC 13528 / IAM 13628 / NBRC 14792 / USDA 110) TaxID=224911 RepID=Q89BY2_BRADU|nr:hypothetical protein Bdiaspc4_42395 [Bradyrhizobium diazoefficiens]BAC53281.1 bsl8016 [Bradyrhizobium diazoefficiens USDA 110]